MSSSYKYFSVADFCVFGVTIAVSLGIGIYYALSGGKQRTTAEYFVGNRKMNIVPVAISLMVSFESSIMMLGTPAEVYVYGLQWFIGSLGFCAANMLATFVFVPLIHPLRITSAYEYLELRFKSRSVRTLGTVIGMMSYIIYMGIVLFGPAIALEGVTGFPQWGSILSVAAASIMYTSVGGLKAVIWTDVFQCLVMFAGILAVLIKGTIQIGGVQKTWEVAYDKGRVNLFNFDPDPTVRHTFWCLFIGSLMRGGGLIFNQSSVQRISSIATIREAKKVMYYVTPAFMISLFLAGVEGIVIYSYYDTKRCDPLASKQIRNPNQIVPYIVMDIFENLEGMPGLFMASIFSASLSTLSSGLSSMSALFWTDIVKPHVRPMSDMRATIISKTSVVVFGGLAVFIAFVINLIGGILNQIAASLMSAFMGPLTGLFLFGAFFPFGNAKGAFFGTLLSGVVTFTIIIGQMTTKGAVKNTRLPLAPIDFCPAVNSTIPPHWSTYNYTILGTSNDVMNDSLTMFMSTMETIVRADIPEPTGFRRLFMVSYQWFAGIGILQVFLYGTIISYFTGFTKPEDIDKRTVLPFYDTLFPFLPECIRQPLRCGYDEVLDKSKVYDAEYMETNANIIIEQQPEANNAILLTNSVKLDHNMEVELTNMDGTTDKLTTETEDRISLSDVFVSTSVEDIQSPRIPIKNMEFELIKSGGNVGNMSEDSGPVFIVLDKTDEEHILRLKAKSIEFDVRTEVPEASAKLSSPVEPDAT